MHWHIFDLCKINRRNTGICCYSMNTCLGHLDTIKMSLRCIFTCQSDNKYKIFSGLPSQSCSRFRVTDRLISLGVLFLNIPSRKVLRSPQNSGQRDRMVHWLPLLLQTVRPTCIFSFLHWIASCFTSLNHLKSAFTLELRPDGIKVSRQRQDKRRKFSL